MNKVKHNPHNARTVFSEHCFFWDTKLSIERMEEICTFINSLNPHQRIILDELLSDIRQATIYDEGDSLF